MLYLNPDYADSFEYDRKFKDTCCGLAQRCNTYYRRRPADECTNYDPPERSKSVFAFTDSTNNLLVHNHIDYIVHSCMG